MRSIISLYILFYWNYVLLLYTFIFVKKHHLPYRKERYINALGVMHNAVILPERATRCRYRPRAWVLVRLAWPGSAAQGKPRRRQARQAVALRRPGKTRKVSPGFEKYCTKKHHPTLICAIFANSNITWNIMQGFFAFIQPSLWDSQTWKLKF